MGQKPRRLHRIEATTTTDRTEDTVHTLTANRNGVVRIRLLVSTELAWLVAVIAVTCISKREREKRVSLSRESRIGNIHNSPLSSATKSTTYHISSVTHNHD